MDAVPPADRNRTAVGLVSRVSPPSKKTAGHPKLMLTMGLDKSCSASQSLLYHTPHPTAQL